MHSQWYQTLPLTFYLKIFWNIYLIINRSHGQKQITYIVTTKHAALEDILFSNSKEKTAIYIFVPMKTELSIKTKKVIAVFRPNKSFT